MIDKNSANYKEGTIREAIADFRKALKVEYAQRTKIQLLRHIEANNPYNKSGDFVLIAMVRQETAIAALEKMLLEQGTTK